MVPRPPGELFTLCHKGPRESAVVLSARGTTCGSQLCQLRTVPPCRADGIHVKSQLQVSNAVPA